MKDWKSFRFDRVRCFRSPTWIYFWSRKIFPRLFVKQEIIEIERLRDIEAPSHALANRLRTPVQLLIDTERIYVSFVDKLRGQWKEEKRRPARA